MPNYCYHGCPCRGQEGGCAIHEHPEHCQLNLLYNNSLVLQHAAEQGRVMEYAPGDKVWNCYKIPWVVTSSELHCINGSLKQLYRCGRPGTDDYCALYLDEICLSDGSPIVKGVK